MLSVRIIKVTLSRNPCQVFEDVSEKLHGVKEDSCPPHSHANKKESGCLLDLVSVSMC